MNTIQQQLRNVIWVLMVLWVSAACTEKNKAYLYEVNDVQVEQSSATKNRPKSDIEFISVVYTDLFNKTISQNELTILLNGYNGVGDKSLITDMIVRSFLNNPAAKVPTLIEMKADPEKFITEAYQKFFVRKPGEYEKWFWVKQIKENQNLNPQLIYYTFLTAREYKFY